MTFNHYKYSVTNMILPVYAFVCWFVSFSIQLHEGFGYMKTHSYSSAGKGRTPTLSLHRQI